MGPEDENPGLEALGKIRQAELEAAAEVLHLHRVVFLDYIDSELDQVNAGEVIDKIVRLLRQVRPHVVVTFAPDGDYGHPDHIALSQYSSAALVCAADPTYLPGEEPPHRVSKFYYLVNNLHMTTIINSLVGDVEIEVDGSRRSTIVWPDWEISTCLDVHDDWLTARQAICCHTSQLPSLGDIDRLPLDVWEELLINQNSFYRVYSLVNSGRAVEDDLFTGLR
jgi:LmbE family N-acetylglucosaminyl deacetylase